MIFFSNALGMSAVNRKLEEFLQNTSGEYNKIANALIMTGYEGRNVVVIGMRPSKNSSDVRTNIHTYLELTIGGRTKIKDFLQTKGVKCDFKEPKQDRCYISLSRSFRIQRCTLAAKTVVYLYLLYCYVVLNS